MADPRTQLARVAAAAFANWTRREHGHDVNWVPPDQVEPDLALLSVTVGPAAAALAIVPLFDATADPETLRRKAALEERLSRVGMEGLIIWLPPRAALPADDVEQVASRVVAAAQALGDGERAEIGFPVKLGLRKVGEEGSYLSVAGGLSPHWARFTGQVVGQFQLDSSAIHRLSESPAEVTKLIDFIVLVANGIRAPGKMVEVDAEDTWVIERLPGLARPTLLVASPQATPDDGAAVRKALRAGTRRAADRVAATSAVLTILAFVGIYRSMESENAAIALRGMDPAIFSQFDLACLVADGRVKVLFGPKRGTVLAAQPPGPETLGTEPDDDQ